jgi:hypothetical protein
MRRIRLAAATVIAAAVAVTVIAVPAASAGVQRHGAKVTITHECCPFGPDRAACDNASPGHCVLWHGSVESEVRKCERRRVVLFRVRPGADRRLGATRSERGEWSLNAPVGERTYAMVKRKVLKDGDVCLAARTRVPAGLRQMPGNAADRGQSRQSGITFRSLLSLGSPLTWWTSSGTSERPHSAQRWP